MSGSLSERLPLTHWQGDRGTYHLVTFSGAAAESLAQHALLERLELERRRGFGSVKLTARIGNTKWLTSVFPQKGQSEWVLLVSKEVMRAEDLARGDQVDIELIL
ncbi:MAG: DUF1905 domain-containing protein [Pseudomonadota bacterium]